VSLFVTGTDTGVGKTHTVTQLLRILRAAGKTCAGFKPICCGDRQDAELLLRASDERFTIDEINPLWLKTPLAPLAAALAEKVTIDIDHLITSFETLQKRVEHIVVEGVGGWMVPIRRDYFVGDLAAALKLPVLIVAQNRLGCLNHTVLTARSVAAQSLRCVGVALNTPPGANDIAATTNAEILREILDIPVLPGLTEKMPELPSSWGQIFDSTVRHRVSSK
jgi:dethiobiotin synthetase